MNQTDYNGLFAQMKSMISDYKKNVIDQKYQNDLAELESLLKSLQQLRDDYFKDNQRDFNQSVMERIDSEVKEAIDYINLIANETAEFIRKDKNLPDISADVLLAQNNYIKNLSLRDEVNRQVAYYEKASLKVRDDYKKHKTEQEFAERFVVLENAEGRKKYIVKECVEAYQKVIKMKRDLNYVLRNDLKMIQNLYNRYLKEMPPVEMGEIVARDVNPSLRLLSDEEIRTKAQDILKQAHSFKNFEGMKRLFHFTFEGHDYHVVVPMGKKAAFERCLQDLAECRDVLLERENMRTREPVAEVIVSEDYINISIDRALFDNMTLQQKVSYLQSVLLRIESQQKGTMIQVHDINGREKSIPAYYYNTYIECIAFLNVLSMTIDHKHLEGLELEDKIRYCKSVMDRIKSLDREPFVVVNGEKISAIYYQAYVEAKNLYSKFVSERKKIDTPNQNMIEDKTTKREYMIDEDYVRELPFNLQLSYYANLIGKIATSNMTPTVVYEAFGAKLNIPVNLVTTVQECEKRANALKETVGIMIDQDKVKSKSPEMQFGYYTNLIEKMKHSNKMPKVTVNAFGETIEIPQEYLNNFQECLKQIDMLKARFELANKTYIKVENVKKPKTQKIKEYFKNLSTRMKITLGMAGFAAAAFLGMGMSKAQMKEEADRLFKANRQTTVETQVDDQDEPSLDSTTKQYDASLSNDPINDMINSANQTLASRLGGTVYLNQEKIYNSYDSQTPLNTSEAVKNTSATIVVVSVKMPDGTFKNVNYTEIDAQAKIEEFMSQGGVVERVGVVSANGENNFKQTGYITGFINVDDSLDFTHASATNLSQEIQEALNQGRSL